ncbi:hypothetical protein ACHAXA_010286 [Cyclostephanos tholiformis]|uniref:Uncharacterized protein n=1 Tax=Cyclostephanos tholiformis TaxID=382380 RepID=A0ABD3RDB8_9STRA
MPAWSLPKPPSGEIGVVYPDFTQELGKQQHMQVFDPFPFSEEFSDWTNPFRQRMPPVSPPPINEGDDRTKIVLKTTNKPNPSSHTQTDVSGSLSQLSSNNILDNRSPSFVTLLPGGGVPDRLDASVSPISLDPDIALGSADHEDDNDDDMSISSPSIVMALTRNISEDTTDVNFFVEEGRGRRGQSNSSGCVRQRRLKKKTRTSPAVRLNHNDETKWSMRDITESVRQILTTVRRFGPDEWDAVMETLLEVRYLITSSSLKIVACGANIDDIDDGSRSLIPDSKLNSKPRARRVLDGDINTPTSRRCNESSSSDGSDDGWNISREDRRWERAQEKEYSEAPVVYSMPIKSFVHPQRMAV